MEYTLAFIVKNNAQQPLEGVGIRLSIGAETRTNRDGYAAVQVPEGWLSYTCHHEKYADTEEKVVEIRKNRDEPVSMSLKPARGFLKPLAPRSGLVWDFQTEDGRPWLFAGYTMHLLLPQLHKGIDVDARLDEAKRYGANTIVTIGTHLSDWKRDHGYGFHPLSFGSQDLLAAMFDKCSERGLRVAHAVLADAQYLSESQKDYIWRQSCEVAQGRENVLLRLGNECFSNGYDPGRFWKPDLHGVLCSKGSTGIGKPPLDQPWDFSEWEPRRKLSILHKCFDDAGAGIQEQYVGYISEGVRHGPWQCPILAIEPAFFHDTPKDAYGDDRWTDPRLALQLGQQIALNCAGGAFGSSDSLEAKPLGPIAAACARQFYRGLTASFLRE